MKELINLDKPQLRNLKERQSDMNDRFKNWQYPKIREGKLTKYNWMVQHKDNLA